VELDMALESWNGPPKRITASQATRMGTLRTLRTLRICIHPRGWRTWLQPPHMQLQLQK